MHRAASAIIRVPGAGEDLQTCATTAIGLGQMALCLKRKTLPGWLQWAVPTLDRAEPHVTRWG